MSAVYDDRPCELGEGPLWHPLRQELFWFDILGNALHSKAQSWTFAEHVSAAGWVDENRLLIASESALFTFDLTSGEQEHVCALEADIPETRSNDGRADPFGGFWIGTMGKAAETGAGAIYRYYRGELRKLFAPITISNAICFAPDGTTAYFTDTLTRRIMRQPLDGNGWPRGEPELHIDLSGPARNPDGAVIDAEDNMWCAEWGSGHVACYDPEGKFVRSIGFAAPNTSCPAFGGPDLTRLFVTTARQGMSADALEEFPKSGQVFVADAGAIGQAEHRVVL